MFGRKKEKAVSSTPQNVQSCTGKATKGCSGKSTSACSGKSSTKTISDNCKCAK